MAPQVAAARNPGAVTIRMARIGIQHLAAAHQKVQAMDLKQKEQQFDQIFLHQPHLLASCLVQPRLGADMNAVGVLLNILLVCYQAMQETGLHWPLISEDEQERQLARTVGAILFSEQMADPALAEQARNQYIADHPEPLLLQFTVQQCTLWLLDLNQRGAEAESDKYVMMAAVNLVNCIAHAPACARLG